MDGFDYPFVLQDNTCATEHRIIGLFTILTVACLASVCASTCATSREIESLKNENETLKSLILKSIDKVLLRMMKNGSTSDNEHED